MGKNLCLIDALDRSRRPRKADRSEAPRTMPACP